VGAEAPYAGRRLTSKPSEVAVAFKLTALPYAPEALAPHLSARTLEFHHGKHHAAYVKKLNELIVGTNLADKSLEQIIHATAGARDTAKEQAKIFNNAAQVWNHDFYWHSMAPGAGGQPGGALARAIDRDFGSFEKFATCFNQAGVGQFGSGWVWLVMRGGKLSVVKTGNADLPLAHGQTALLTADVWEHAYYLDYQNRRPDYLTAFLAHLANWQFAASNFETAKDKAA